MSKFGGDPTRVTISGESAGAGSVVLHVLAQGGSLENTLFTNVSLVLETLGIFEDVKAESLPFWEGNRCISISPPSMEVSTIPWPAVF